MWILIFLVLVVMLFLVIRVPGGKGYTANKLVNKFNFYLKGMDAGFALSEIKLLWSGIKHSNFGTPSRIFGSIESLDALIGELIRNKKFLERNEAESETLALRNLFAYRKDIELNRMKHYLGLKTTRNVPIGQELTIRVGEAGVYSSKVVENEDDYLTITIPVGDPLPVGFSWRRSKLNVYLWRKDDGGYFFQTRLVEKFYDKRNLFFHLKHSDSIIRSQKRSFIRAPARIHARLFLRESPENSGNSAEYSPECDCLITDISEGGVSLKTDGFVRKGNKLKLQFTVRNEGVVITGVVKECRYDQTGNESILHVEFARVSENLNMLLLSYIFDIDQARSNAINQEKDSAESIYEVGQLEGEIPDSDEAEIENLADEEIEEQDEKAIGEVEEVSED